MEDVLDLYADAPDDERPVVCFDESPTQLIGEVRQPIPAEPGQIERYDYDYRRNGTVNLFVFLDAHKPWRKVKVTDHRAAGDFAECMRDLVDIHYPKPRRSASCLTICRLILSWAPSASIDASPTATSSAPKSPFGGNSAMTPARVSTGCSQPNEPAPRWLAFIRSFPTSHNPCAAVLAPAWRYGSTD
jgi:hypothetical protein